MSLSTNSFLPEHSCYTTSCDNSLENNAFGNGNDAFGNIQYLRNNSLGNNASGNIQYLQKHAFRDNIGSSHPSARPDARFAQCIDYTATQPSQAAQASQFPNTDQYLVSGQHDEVTGI